MTSTFALTAMRHRLSRRAVVRAIGVVALYPLVAACDRTVTATDARVPLGTENQLEEIAVSRIVQSLGQAAGAAIQAIVAVNASLYTDRAATTYEVWQSRTLQALQALATLERVAEATDRAAGSTASGKVIGLAQVSTPPQLQASPDTVRAFLNASATQKPVAALMKEYRVNARTAFTMLQSAMATESAEAYKEERSADRAVRVLTLVKEGAALTVNLGATAITAGAGTAAGAALATLSTAQKGTALIEGLNGLVKTGIAGYELYVGQDSGPTGTLGMAVNGLATAADIVAVKGAWDLFAGARIPRLANAPLNTTALPTLAIKRADPSDLIPNPTFMDMARMARNSLGRIRDGVVKYGRDYAEYAARVVPSEVSRLVRQEQLAVLAPATLGRSSGEVVDKLMFLSGKAIDLAREGKATGGNETIWIGDEFRALMNPPSDRLPKPIGPERQLPNGTFLVPTAGGSTTRVTGQGIDPVLAGTIGASLPPNLVQPIIRSTLGRQALTETRTAPAAASAPKAGAASPTSASPKPSVSPSGAATASPRATASPQASATSSPRPSASPAPTSTRAPATATAAASRSFTARFVGTSRAEKPEEGSTGTMTSTGQLFFTVTGGSVTGTWSGEGDAGTLTGTFANGRITGSWSGHFGRARASGSWSGTVSPDGAVNGTIGGTYDFGSGNASERGTLAATWSGSGTAAEAAAGTAVPTEAGYTGDIAGMVARKLADVAAGRGDATSYGTQYQGEVVQVKVDAAGNPYMETLSGKQTRLNRDGSLAEPFKK